MEKTPHTRRESQDGPHQGAAIPPGSSRRSISNEPANPSRRHFLKKAALATAGTALLAGGYASLWEPNHLEITRFNLSLPRLPSAFDGIRVVHFSDVHLGFHMDEQDLRELADRIAGLKPDLLCFTGDIVDDYAVSMKAAVPVMASMHATLGKFAILGNHDYRGLPAGVQELYPKTGFTLLRNEHAIVERAGQRVAMVGLEDNIMGKPNPQRAIHGLPDEMCKLLLMHEPDYADVAAQMSFDLQLSGHTHGGQVRLPVIGAPMPPPGGRKYIQGLFHVGTERMPLYVSRGIGMTHLPIRVLCRPELSVITLKSGQ